MAIKVTNWNSRKCTLFVLDAIIFLINIALFGLTLELIKKEYDNRSTIKLFVIPFLVSILNVLIDFLMNKTNYIMKYAGHNRYGMMTRFFMFYFILTIILYSDQREKYVNKYSDIDINKLINILGITDIGLLILSMILSFFIIDIQNFNLIMVKKKKKAHEPIAEELDIIQSLVPEELKE